MKLVCKSDVKDFLVFVSQNIYANTYIIGNYTRYGVSDSNVKYHVSDGKIRFVLMKYYNDYVFYTNIRLEKSDIVEIKNEINNSDCRVLTGNEYSVNQLLDSISFSRIRRTKLMSYISKDPKPIINSLNIRKVNISHKNQLLHLFRGIEEFGDKYDGVYGDERLKNTIKFDYVYGYFLNDNIIGAVNVTANSGKSCMLTDVCVLKTHRNKGISKTLINYLTKELRSKGLKHINLYVDNEIALNMYSKLGFEYKEEYLAIYRY